MAAGRGGGVGRGARVDGSGVATHLSSLSDRFPLIKLAMMMAEALVRPLRHRLATRARLVPLRVMTGSGWPSTLHAQPARALSKGRREGCGGAAL